MKPTDHVLMVRPASFRANEQTAANNHYQKQTALTAAQSLLQAQSESDTLASCLRMNNIKVTVVQDTLTPDTPDALFPNNWFALLGKGQLVLFPMFAENRRAERSNRIFEALSKVGYEVMLTVDYSVYEQKQQFLEGTGSMVLDHQHSIAYCALSARADAHLFHLFCEAFNFKPVVFHAFQTVGTARLLIYHTNVMMMVAPAFALVCLDAVDDPMERALLQDSLTFSGKIVIPLTEKQLTQFAGNMLALTAIDGTALLVMSTRAYDALTTKQLLQLQQYVKLVHSPIPTIEDLGGGSVRCMLAEIY
tara:strand:- start:427 stop:1344 length:918 start_codon:yes stop_codon:yes gene_type:complete